MNQDPAMDQQQPERPTVTFLDEQSKKPDDEPMT
jgi:hypothetical protein